MAGDYRGVKRIHKFQQLEEDNEYPWKESESSYSSLDGYESLMSEQISEDLENDCYHKEEEMKKLENNRRYECNRQCLRLKLSKTPKRVHSLTGISDQRLFPESEQAKIRQLRYKIANLYPDLKFLEEKFERTTSKLKRQIKEKDDEIDYLQDQLGQTQFELERFKRNVPKYFQQQIDSLMATSFYGDIDIYLDYLQDQLGQTQFELERFKRNVPKYIQQQIDTLMATSFYGDIDIYLDYLQDQLGQTQFELERFKRYVPKYFQQQIDTLMTTIFYRDIDIHFLHATILDLENELQNAQMDIKVLVENNKDQLQGAMPHIKKLETEMNKTKHERDRAIQVKTELEVQAKKEESRIRSLKKEINDSDISIRKKREKTFEHLKLKKTIEVTEKQDRRRKGNDKNEREEQLKETNNQKQKSMTSLKSHNSMIERKLPHDHNKQEIVTQEEDVKGKGLKLTDEQIKINNLMEQIEKRDKMLQSLNECLENTQNKVENVEDLNQVIKEMKEQLSEQKKLLKEALSKLGDKEATLKNMRHKMDFERQTKLDLEKKSRERITELKSENEKINQRKQALENDIKQRDLELKAFEKRAKVDVSMEQEIGNIIRGKNIQIAKLEDQIQQSFARLKETETELEQTKSRLSKAMGDRLKDNNPNIADLSDENRPVKLAERYSELYDNQWTDAFDFLSKSLDSEQTTIEALLEILQDITQFCIASASKQMEDLQGILVFSNTSVGDVPVDVRLQLKNFRKALSKTAMRNLYESYILHMKQTAPDTLRGASEIRPYVQECFEICWLMSIQDPPVVFAPVAKQGSILNTNIYKPYTSSGTHVEYTVWPAMLLHENGPILAKGVAQGRKQSAERRK